jgi:hypothetical protein
MFAIVMGSSYSFSLSSFTMARLLPNEQASSIRDCLVQCIADFKCSDSVTVRTDNAPAMQSLVHDDILSQNGITIELGRIHNKNKNPVAERAIQEL